MKYQEEYNIHNIAEFRLTHLNFPSVLCTPLAQRIRTVGHISDVLEEVYVVKLSSLN